MSAREKLKREKSNQIRWKETERTRNLIRRFEGEGSREKIEIDLEIYH